MKDIIIVKKPWGYEQHLPNLVPTMGEKELSYRVKILVVYPKQALSFQYHKLKDEHWKVIGGSGTIILNQSVYPAYTGTEWYIPAYTSHQLMAGKKEAIIVKEYSTGKVFDDYDIIRISDKYGRI